MVSDTTQGKNIDDSITWKESGNELFNKGQYEEAAKCYSHAIELNPEFIEAWNNLGLSLLKLGKIDEAKKCNEKVKELKERQKLQLRDTTKQTIPPIIKNQFISKKPEELAKIRKKYEDGLLSYEQYQDCIKGQTEGKSYTTSSPIVNKPTKGELSVMEDIPFILNLKERIIEQTNVGYFGEDIILQTSGVGVGYTGSSGFGVGVGSATSTPKKKMTDFKNCKLYITNQRLIFIGREGGVITKKRLGKVHAIIPIENIERILIDKFFLGAGASYLGLSISTPKGTLEIRVIFSMDEEFKKRPKEEQVLEYWENVLKKDVQDRKQLSEVPNGNLNLQTSLIENDPMLILKSRLSKGEISEDEFIRLKKLLE